ncbi:MAG: hypothetical protein IPP27_06040 [Bacteroidetes bacterium]|nr:hypothetical protein [Bacteroidota bacterium]
MLLTEFNNFLIEKDLLKQGQNVLVAVSGGLDSIVLCRLLRESKIDFVIAHCNFKLRGKESDGDEEFVKKLRLLIMFRFIVFNLRQSHMQKRINFQYRKQHVN